MLDRMSDPGDLAEFLDTMVARAVDDSAPVRSAETGVPTVPGAPVARLPRRVAYGAARRAYHLALKVQNRLNVALLSDIATLQGEHAALRVDLASAQAAIAGLEVATTRLNDLSERLTNVLAELGARPDHVSEERLDRMYADFEAEFRGSFDMIAQRLRIYLDYLWPLADNGAPALDLGCGRGEWLNLLAEHGIEASGVDLSSEFVESCLDRGLNARVADVFTYLPTVGADSLGVVTAFQLVEHVNVSRLVELVDEVFRTLRPGGRMILETPNPSNLSVGAASFFRDPTHLRVVHPEFLDFLARHCGFADTEIRYLHPRAELGDDVRLADADRLDELARDAHWALRGPQDYAVIATKPG
jgi:O-antigen chain-terminating methyltransferase